jgi:hypothetical protein
LNGLFPSWTDSICAFRYCFSKNTACIWMASSLHDLILNAYSDFHFEKKLNYNHCMMWMAFSQHEMNAQFDGLFEETLHRLAIFKIWSFDNYKFISDKMKVSINDQ